MALVLILLGLGDPLYRDNRLIYPLTVFSTGVVSVLTGAGYLGLTNSRTDPAVGKSATGLAVAELDLRGNSDVWPFADSGQKKEITALTYFLYVKRIDPFN